MNQTAAILPFLQPLEQWEVEGRTLGERERSAKSLMWDIGDWWNRGPAPGTQFPSVIRAPLGEHSAKPAAFAEMIEEMFPSLPALGLFARGPRLGWDVWGNEAQ
jgi:N6-adenosine-specific RNA methylase IME4